MKQDVEMETNEAQPQYRLATHVTNANASRLMLDLEVIFRMGVVACVHPKSTDGREKKTATACAESGKTL